ncbi:hypothetical protein [Ruegeria conchae]|uniref:hypothetical protein n=1 Tax=Ruegeria conchae TaxID=981384 RepID=UPI0029C82089|nr:hypothetical protein [Ruegeria conchae]
MLNSNGLEDVANKENWIDFGEALEEAVENPIKYGLRTPAEVLNKVAELRGKRSHTLRNPLEAYKWLNKRFPEVQRERPAWLGMTLVMFLMKIEELDRATAERLAPLVFGGQMRQVQLKAEFDRLRQERAERHSQADLSKLSSPQRAQIFDQTVFSFLRQYGPKMFGSENAVLKDGRSLGSLYPDYVIEVDGKPKVAVEINAHRTRVERQFTINTLGYLWLLRRLVPEALLVVPQDSGYDLKQLAKLRDEIGLDGIRFATLPEAGAKRFEDLVVQE